MTDKEIIGKVHAAVYRQCRSRGYAAPVDVLMDIGGITDQTRLSLLHNQRKALVYCVNLFFHIA